MKENTVCSRAVFLVCRGLPHSYYYSLNGWVWQYYKKYLEQQKSQNTLLYQGILTFIGLGCLSNSQQGKRGSNPHLRFWRPLLYHWTIPLQRAFSRVPKYNTINSEMCQHFLQFFFLRKTCINFTNFRFVFY